MGMGDELMASGAARKLFKGSGAGMAVCIVGADGRPRWDPLWEGLPYIVKKIRDHNQVTRMVSGGGIRPYIARKTADRWFWRPYKPSPATIIFTPEELAFAEPYRGRIMIEPNVKNTGHTNKAWIETRWIELVNRIGPVIQCVPSFPGMTLPNTTALLTRDFRHACAVLSVCKAFIGTEGGLMHAAAAVGTPAVILWSEFISPEITGYALPTMINIRHADKACGMRHNCPGCRKSMEKITVDMVVDALERLL